MSESHRGMDCSTGRLVLTLLACVSLLIHLAAPSLLAAPQGASVQAGDVTIDQAGATTTIHAANNAIIDYQSFNIAGHETVRFVQPNVNARVLNRVLDGNVTRIDGRLLSNGQVYLVNPAGIYFGNQAVVNVGHLTAAAGTITNSDFLANADRFTQVTGSVINTGTIEGRAIALIGNHVANRGQIVAPEGLVTLAAGETVYLARQNGGLMVQLEGGADDGTAAVENTGTIDAPRGAVNLGASDVYTLAARHSGTIKADQVNITADGGAAQIDGTIDAANPTGTGGKVIVMADHTALYESGVIDVSGEIGGFVELSARMSLAIDGVVNRIGTGGTHGTLLIDPKDIIVMIGGGGTVDQSFSDDPTLTVTIDPATIVAALNGGDVVLQANNDITLKDAIDASGNSLPGNLSLEAGRSILIQSDITLRGSFEAKANRTFANGVVDAQRMAGAAVVTMDPGTTIDTTAGGGRIEISVNGGWGLTEFTSGDITLANLLAGGDIEIVQEGRTAGSGIVFLAGSPFVPTVSTGLGSIEASAGDINQQNTTGGITVGGLMQSVDEDIELFAPGTIAINPGGGIAITGGGEIELWADTIAMADGSSIGTAGGDVGVIADNDVTISQINVFGDNDDAINVVAINGGIFDAGDADPLFNGGADLNSFDGEVRYDVGADMLAANGIGQGANGGIETNIPYLTTQTDDTAQALNPLDDIMSFGLDAGAGAIAIDSAFATLSDTDGRYDIIADTVNISLGGSIVDGGVPDNHPSANSSAVDFKLANAAGSTFNISGANDAMINAAPIDVTVSDGNTGRRVSTTGSITIDSTPVNQTDPLSLEADGDIHIAIRVTTTGDSSDIDLETGGLLTIDRGVTASGAGSDIDARAAGGVDINVASGGLFDRLTTTSGDIYVDAFDLFDPAQPGFDMEDSTLIDAGSGRVEIFGAGDLTIAHLATTNAQRDAIELFSLFGGTRDAGDTDVDLLAPNGGVEVETVTGFGVAVDPLESQIARFDASNQTSGDVALDNIGDLTIDGIVNFAPGRATQIDAASAITLDDVVISNNGTVMLAATESILLNDVILFADTVTVQAATTGTGTLSWGESPEGIAADTIVLIAGDGPGGAASARVDARTNQPFFVNAALDGAPIAYQHTQDASLAPMVADAADPEQFRLTGSIAGVGLTYESIDGGLAITDDGSNPGAALVANAPSGDVTLNGVLIGSSIDVTAGNTIAIAALITATDPADAVNLDAAHAIVMADGSVIDGGASNVDLLAGPGGIFLSQIATASNDPAAIFLASAGPVLDVGDADPLANGGADLHAPNGNVMVNAGASDIGSALDAIEVNVATPTIGNFMTTGNVFVDFGDDALVIDTPVDNANDDTVQMFTSAGTITVDATINTSGDNSGIVLNSSGGGVDVNQALTTGGMNSSISIGAAQDITIDALVQASGAGSDVNLTADGDVSVTPTGTVSSTQGAVMILADANDDNAGGTVTVDGTIAAPIVDIQARGLTHNASDIDAGAGGRVTIVGQDDQPMHLGATHDAGTDIFEIEQSVLDIITAAVLHIVGADTAGGIEVLTSIMQSNVDTLRLSSAAAVTTAPGASITANKLAVDAVGGIDLETIVSDLAAQTAFGGIGVSNSGDVRITTVDGVNGLTAFGEDADVFIEAFSSITGSGPVSVPDGSFEAFASGDIDLTGVFSVGGDATFAVEGGSIKVADPASSFGGAVDFQGGESDPADITFQAGSPVTFDGFTAAGDVTITVPAMNMTTQLESTGGDMTFNGDLVLSGSDWTVNGRVNSDAAATPRRLTVNTFGSGTTRFVGTVGAGANDVLDSDIPTGTVGGDDLPLFRLETNADGQTIIQAVAIILQGSSAQFDNPARITNDLEITELGGGDVTFGNTLDGSPGANPSLTINQSMGGNVNFNNTVGGDAPLNNMTVNTSGGQANVNGDVTTSGSQDWNTPVNAADDTTLTGTDVNLNEGTTGAPPQVIEVASASASDTNVAELLPGGSGGTDAGEQIGQTSALAELLADNGIDVPTAMRGSSSARVVQRAADDYLLDQPLGAAFNARGFVNDLARRANRQALFTLIAARDVLEQIAGSDLPDAMKADLRRRVIEQMKPTGITTGEFMDVLDALPRDGAVALAS